MILMAAVDDNMGLMFNHRRQSRDRLLRQRILALAGDRALWMDRYSADLFGKELEGHTVRVDEDFLTQAAPGDFCWLEDRSPLPAAERIEQVILFRWNRAYPADLYFDLDLTGWTLTSSEDFPGSSHDKITQEVYTRA